MLGDNFEDCVEQIAESLALLCADRVRLAKPQRVKVVYVAQIVVVDFVYRKNYGKF